MDGEILLDGVKLYIEIVVTGFVFVWVIGFVRLLLAERSAARCEMARHPERHKKAA